VNYQRIYNNLISFRQCNPVTGYTENHHIVMRSMGGSDDASNLVRLTGREHWVAHLLLYKIHKNSQSVHACNMMAMRCEERGIPYIKNSRMYEAIRKKVAKQFAIRNKNHIGENNSQYGTRWICNLELHKNKKISKDAEIPEGWIAGRNKWSINKNVREKLKSGIWITNGIIFKRLSFVDQLPIPEGWWRESRKQSNKTKEKLSKIWSGNERLYRRGLKHKKNNFNGYEV
jgi:hypothetical protein